MLSTMLSGEEQDQERERLRMIRIMVSLGVDVRGSMSEKEDNKQKRGTNGITEKQHERDMSERRVSDGLPAE